MIKKPINKSLIRKLKLVFFALFVAGIIVVVIFFVIGLVGPKNAGLAIDTNPSALVFINGEQVGRTPYETTRESSEINVKLVPESFDKPLTPYEIKIKLVSGVRTIVLRNFSQSDEEASGVVVSYEKGEGASISVVSIPDSSEVKIDGNVVGFTPHKSASITEGEHVISVSSEGFEEESLTVKAVDGYNLTAVFKLARKASEQAQPENPEVEEKNKKITKVKIAETTTGFLRVRKEPSTLAEEVGQVKPGEEYVLLEEDERTGWYKIEINSSGTEDEDQDKEESESKITGWISNEYSEKFEVEE